MRAPKELGEAELAQIAYSVRERLYAEFGLKRVSSFLQHDPDVALAFVKATYIKVREKLEIAQ